MIVVDLGCCPHDGDISIGRLIDRHHPEFLYGFDPLLELEKSSYGWSGTEVRLERKAAWTEDGEGILAVGGRTLLNATMMEDKYREEEWKNTLVVPLFDFGAWLEGLEESPIVKMNIEGAEFPLLEDLISRHIDPLITLLYVSWHDDRMGSEYTRRRKALEENLLCPIERWALW